MRCFAGIERKDTTDKENVMGLLVDGVWQDQYLYALIATDVRGK